MLGTTRGGPRLADMSDKMKATVQPHVPEPVIVVGVLQPAGTWGAMGAIS